MTISFFHQFFTFLKTFGIIGLALALVIGQASTNMVSSLVDDIINPFVGLFLPAGNLDSVTVKITNFFGTVSVFNIGHLLSGIINFAIMAFIIFLAYIFLSKLHLVAEEGEKKEGKTK